LKQINSPPFAGQNTTEATTLARHLKNQACSNVIGGGFTLLGEYIDPVNNIVVEFDSKPFDKITTSMPP
jgi:hypothetical protein